MAVIDTLKNARHDLFAERDTINEAINYATKIIETFNDNKIEVYTALHVVINTIHTKLKEEEEAKKKGA